MNSEAKVQFGRVDKQVSAFGLDTAPIYGHGISELCTGHSLRWKERDDLVLSSKVGRVLKPARKQDIRFASSNLACLQEVERAIAGRSDPVRGRAPAITTLHGRYPHGRVIRTKSAVAQSHNTDRILINSKTTEIAAVRCMEAFTQYYCTVKELKTVLQGHSKADFSKTVLLKQAALTN